MQVTETYSEGLKREFKVVVPAADLDQQVTAKLQEVGQGVKLPGFRPGKVPLGILKRRFGRSVLGEVVDGIVNETLRKTMDERGIRPAVTPDFAMEEFKEDADLQFTIKLEILPEITPMDFSSLEFERLEVEAGDKEIGDALDRIAQNSRSAKPVEEARPAATGDVAVIDFVGKVDGEAFAGGSAEGYELELGGGNFLPGFEDQLVGANVGETREVNVKFPEDYGAGHLAGKDAVFDVTVTELRAYETAAIDDELAKKAGFETLDELRTAVKTRIEQDYAAIARTRVKRELFDKLDAAHRFEIPPGMAQQQFDTIWQQVESELKGENAETFREGKSDEELRADYEAIAQRRVRLGLLLAEVARANNISVSREDLTRAMQAEAMRFPGQEQQVYEFYQKNPGALGHIEQTLLEDKVVDFILELAQVSPRKVSVEELLKEAGEGEAQATPRD